MGRRIEIPQLVHFRRPCHERPYSEKCTLIPQSIVCFLFLFRNGLWFLVLVLDLVSVWFGLGFGFGFGCGFWFRFRFGDFVLFWCLTVLGCQHLLHGFNFGRFDVSVAIGIWL
jgi:hypothetical protein